MPSLLAAQSRAGIFACAFFFLPCRLFLIFYIRSLPGGIRWSHAAEAKYEICARLRIRLARLTSETAVGLGPPDRASRNRRARAYREKPLHFDRGRALSSAMSFTDLIVSFISLSLSFAVKRKGSVALAFSAPLRLQFCCCICRRRCCCCYMLVAESQNVSSCFYGSAPRPDSLGET